MRKHLVAIVLAVGLLATTACGDDDDGASTTTAAEAEETTTSEADDDGGEATDSITEALGTPHTSVVAEAVAEEIFVFADADEASEVTMVLPKFDDEYVGDDGERTTQVFLVDEYRDGWLKVLLPVRPNGTTGWIRLGDVAVSKHRYEIVVELAAHRLVATENGEPFLDTEIAVGTTDTPTPGGRFFLNALMRPPDPDTVYGTAAYALSGYSDTLQTFAGGDGVIGIHGTNDPSVMGTDVSHGCIRMRNEDIEALAARLPLGTPVEIRA